MTMEMDALYAGLPMRNSLDPCNTCTEWLELKQEADRLRAAAAQVTAAFEALGRTSDVPSLLQARGKCESAMLALKNAIAAQCPYPIDHDDGTVVACKAAGHCGCGA